MIQFLKGIHTGELDAIGKLGPDFKIYRYGESNKFINQMDEYEKSKIKESVRNGLLNDVKNIFDSNDCDVLIMDEIMAVLHRKIISIDELLNIIKHKHEDMELIMTGRNAPDELVEMADLVTEMKEIKHYYNKGVAARKGIEY